MVADWRGPSAEAVAQQVRRAASRSLHMIPHVDLRRPCAHSFITFLRDKANSGEATPEVLKSACVAQKHALDTQASSVYDKVSVAPLPVVSISRFSAHTLACRRLSTIA